LFRITTFKRTVPKRRGLHHLKEFELDGDEIRRERISQFVTATAAGGERTE